VKVLRLPVAGDVYEVVVIDVDAVLAGRPVAAILLSAPLLNIRMLMRFTISPTIAMTSIALDWMGSGVRRR